jgi:C1A family cysteine protease
MKTLFLLLILFISSIFIGCSQDVAETHVKTTENKEKIISMGLKEMTESEINSITLAQIPIRGDLPASHDLSDYFPPIGSQGNQGSCAAWSSGYYYKSFQENIERNWGYSTYEHIMSPAFLYNYEHQGESEVACNNSGMTLQDAADILKDVGIVSWSTMPYDDTVCSVGPNNSVITQAYKYRIDDYQRVEFNNFKTFIASNMPIFFGAEIFENFGSCWKYSDCMTEYKNNGNVYKTVRGASEGGHGMVLVGYDDKKQAFKLINSWGTYWGEDGFLWVSYTALSTMLRNYGSYGYVFIDHIEDPCENVDCGYHGECQTTPQKTAYCECDNGYKSNLLTCVACESNSYKQCYNGSVYNFNSCDQMGNIAQRCDDGCENTSSTNAQCVSNCISHSTQKCYDNNIYWYNSCGERESLALTCTDNKTCNDLGDGAVECKSTCTTKSIQKCVDNNIYWYDSCGVRELLVERCDFGVCTTTETGAYCDDSNVDACANVNCPVNSNCQVSENNETACYCNQGYHVNDTATACDADEVVVDLCANVNCPINSHCVAENDDTTCYCDEGFVVNEARTGCEEEIVIPEVCQGITCTTWYPNSICVEYNGDAACDCQDGYHWSGDECIL